MKRRCSVLAAGLLICSLAGCTETQQSSLGNLGESVTDTEQPREAETVDAMIFDSSGVTQTDQRFLADYSQLALSAPEGAEIYYTLDGSRPTKEAERYETPIVLEQYVGDFPHCVVLRAKAYYADGTESDIATQSFWTSFDINSRFKNLVVSVVGDPAEITEKPDGIFFGENVKLRGRESEREISVEAVNADGSLVFTQNAGLRIYGAASREAAIKSMKLYARKSYDEAHGKFAFDQFGTIGADGEIIGKYDKLVLRNAGNDFQFAFIRDELNQRLAAESGFAETEAVMPALVYLNGEYYGLHWLHESLCDDLLKDKFGGKEGTYIVLEGKEQKKNIPDDDEETAAAAEEFNEAYEALSQTDLTDDAAYTDVCAFMDVENYLQYYAFNIYVNNKDWPQNNMKCYRYDAADEAYSTDPNSRQDGRWRFWLHDTDYAYGLYEQDETQANYNNLEQILDAESERYAPMFAALMQREDCRSYFIGEMHRLMNGMLSADHICEVLDAMNAERFIEMRRYFDHLEKLKKTDKNIWIWYQGYQEQTDMIRSYAQERADFMKQFLADAFGERSEDTAD